MINRASLIYIGGYGRSGSTLLDAYISSADGFFGLGECANFYESAYQGDSCECGEKLTACEFWSGFFNQYDRLQMHGLSVEAKRMDSLILRHSGEKCLRFWKAFFGYARDKSGEKIIVDSSKTTRETFYRPFNLSIIGEDVIFIYLYKEPSDLVASLKKGSNKFLAGMNSEKYGFRFLLKSFAGWFVGNVGAVLAVLRLGPEKSIILNYRDFASDPTIVGRCLENFGVSHVPSEMTEGHGISGNRTRSSISAIHYKKPDISGFKTMDKVIVIIMTTLLRIFVGVASIYAVKCK